MFETLDTISAEEASIPVGGRCATLAAQIKHVAFYLDVTDQYFRNPNFPGADWDEIWQTTKEVTPTEWDKLKIDLRKSYDRIKLLIEDTPAWTSEREVGGIMGVIVHTAYHLGEIRQALCTLKG